MRLLLSIPIVRLLPQIRFLILMIFLSSAMLSCQKDEPLAPSPLPAKRTVMIYMSANNNLVTEAYDNLNKMEAGYRDIDGNLIVYARLPNMAPALYEIQHDTSPFIGSKKIKTYPEHDSTNPEVMKVIFADMQSLYPAESYGAILWSHATSWLPSGYDALRLRSFGDDAGRSMDILDLANALPSNLDYLIFDACSMASVEVLYQLKEKASYIIASPTEVVAEGMPYDRFINDLFDENINRGLREVAQHFYDFYDAKSGVYRSATVSLINTSVLSDLAAATKQLLSIQPLVFTDFRINELQQLDFLPGSPTTSFDFIDFLAKNFISSADLDLVRTLMEEVIIYKAHTPFFNNQPINTFSGLSCYVPGRLHDETTAQQYYKTLSWYNSAGFNELF